MRKESGLGLALRLIAAGVVIVPLGRAAAAHADLYARHPAVDVGEVRCGAVLTHKFSFTNRGADAVEVLNVHTTCGCLKPQLSSHTLQPGQEGWLILEVNTLSQASGPHSWPVRITYRDRNGEHDMTLGLSGRIITEISVQPAALTLFTDTSLEHAITLTDLRSRPLAVTTVSTSSPHLRTQVEPRSQDGQGHCLWKIRVSVAAECPQGCHEELIQIGTDDSAYPELHVPVTIVKQPRPRLTAAPSVVTFSVVKDQPTPSRIVVVRDRADEPVAIERIVPEYPALQCRWAQGPGNACTVKLTLDPDRLTGDRWESAVHIHLLKPTAETLTVPVECTRE